MYSMHMKFLLFKFIIYKLHLEFKFLQNCFLKPDFNTVVYKNKMQKNQFCFFFNYYRQCRFFQVIRKSLLESKQAARTFSILHL